MCIISPISTGRSIAIGSLMAPSRRNVGSSPNEKVTGSNFGDKPVMFGMEIPSIDTFSYLVGSSPNDENEI